MFNSRLILLLITALLLSASAQDAFGIYLGGTAPKSQTEASRVFSTDIWYGVNIGVKSDFKLKKSFLFSPRFEVNHYFVHSNIPIIHPDGTFLITADAANIYSFNLSFTYKSLSANVSPIFSSGISFSIESTGRVYTHIRGPNNREQLIVTDFSARKYFAHTIETGLLVRLRKHTAFELTYLYLSNYRDRKFDNVNIGIVFIR